MRRGLAVAAGLVGVIIVLRPGQAEFGLGQFSALGAAVTGSLVSIIVRKIGQEERSAVLMLYPMVANFLVMAFVLPFVYRPLPIEHLGLLALMSGLGFVAGLFIIAAYRTAPAVIVAPLQYSQDIWAALFGYLFLNEDDDGYTLAGTSVIVASGLYIVLREGTPAVSENRPVLESRTRAETALFPRISQILKRR
mgnify:FL=1